MHIGYPVIRTVSNHDREEVFEEKGMLGIPRTKINK